MMCQEMYAGALKDVQGYIVYMYGSVTTNG